MMEHLESLKGKDCERNVWVLSGGVGVVVLLLFKAMGLSFFGALILGAIFGGAVGVVLNRRLCGKTVVPLPPALEEIVAGDAAQAKSAAPSAPKAAPAAAAKPATAAKSDAKPAAKAAAAKKPATAKKSAAKKPAAKSAAKPKAKAAAKTAARGAAKKPAKGKDA